jgi:hypothetical protein
MILNFQSSHHEKQIKGLTMAPNNNLLGVGLNDDNNLKYFLPASNAIKKSEHEALAFEEKQQ